MRYNTQRKVGLEDAEIPQARKTSKLRDDVPSREICPNLVELARAEPADCHKSERLERRASDGRRRECAAAAEDERRQVRGGSCEE